VLDLSKIPMEPWIWAPWGGFSVLSGVVLSYLVFSYAPSWSVPVFVFFYLFVSWFVFARPKFKELQLAKTKEAGNMIAVQAKHFKNEI
jgi:hypothetical protein